MNFSASHPVVILADYSNTNSLICGIGNTGQQDDGLGGKFIDRLERKSICPKAGIISCARKTPT